MIDWPDAAKQGSLIAGGVNVVLLGVLIFTRRWWSLRGGRSSPVAVAGTDRRQGDVVGAGRPREPGEISAKTFWIVLAAVLVVAAGLRINLARSSLWWDEVWQARHASVGQWRPDKKNPGQLRFRETTFAQALWNYSKPANHPPMAITSKACHEVWKKVTGAPPGAFNEFVLRLPGFAASLAGIVLVALLLRTWGMAGGGLVAAFFLALHPWHIRYGIDCRGYTFLVPLTLVGLWALWRACGPGRGALAQRGSVRAGPTDVVAGCVSEREAPAAWWVFGLTQALILWSHLLSVWVCLALCATGVWWIWRQHTGRDRWHRLGRLVAVQVAGAMLLFQLFLPNLLQAGEWGEKNRDGRLLDGAVLLDTLTQAAVGRPSAGLATAALAIFCVIPMVLAGLFLAKTRRVPGLAGMVALFLGGPAFLIAVWAADFYFYPRFLFAIAAPMALGIGISLELLQRQTRELQPWMPAWFDHRFFVGFFAMGIILADGLPTVVKGGFSPLREAAAFLSDGQSRGADVFGYGFGAEALQYYLPTLPYARESEAPDVLAAAVENARAAGRPLLVVVGYEALNRLALPRGFEWLDDPVQFVEVWAQAGMEPQFAYRIRRFEPAAPTVP